MNECWESPAGCTHDEATKMFSLWKRSFNDARRVFNRLSGTEQRKHFVSTVEGTSSYAYAAAMFWFAVSFSRPAKLLALKTEVKG